MIALPLLPTFNEFVQYVRLYKIDRFTSTDRTTRRLIRNYGDVDRGAATQVPPMAWVAQERSWHLSVTETGQEPSQHVRRQYDRHNVRAYFQGEFEELVLVHGYFSLSEPYRRYHPQVLPLRYFGRTLTQE